MKKEKIFYCAARNFPVYYKVDPKAGTIESVKNWSEYPKALDRFEYSAVFARELKTYKPISRQEYEEVRDAVATFLNKKLWDSDTPKGN